MAEAGEFVNSVLAFIKSKYPDVWAKWCELADKVVPHDGALPERYRWLLSNADGSIPAQAVLHRGTLFWKGRSKEQAGAMLFSGRGYEGQKDSVRNSIWHHNIWGELRALENEAWGNVHNALPSEVCLLKGYTDSSKELDAPAKLVTLDALIEARNSGVIVLNGVKWAGLRLVMAETEAPVPSSVSHADVSADAKQGRRQVSKRWQKDRVIGAVGELEDDGVPVKTLTQADLRRRIELNLPDQRPGGLRCPSRTTINEVLEELGLGK